MARTQAQAPTPPPDLQQIDTPEYRDSLAQTLDLYADDQQRIDPPRAQAARAAAQRARTGRELLFRVGHFYSPTKGWVPNYACNAPQCFYSNESARLVATHAEACRRWTEAPPPTPRTVGGIT